MAAEKIKVGIELSLDEITWLSAFVADVVERSPVEFFDLESYVLCWMYERLLGRFTFLKAGKITLRMSEALALKRLLLNTPMTKEYDDIVRITLVSKIGSKCPQE